MPARQVHAVIAVRRPHPDRQDIVVAQHRQPDFGARRPGAPDGAVHVSEVCHRPAFDAQHDIAGVDARGKAAGAEQWRLFQIERSKFNRSVNCSQKYERYPNNERCRSCSGGSNVSLLWNCEMLLIKMYCSVVPHLRTLRLRIVR